MSAGEAKEYPTDRRGLVYASLIAIYITLIILTNTVGTKLFVFMGLTLPVSILCFPFTFLVTDIISDVFGPKQARYFVILGFLASLFLLAFVVIGLSLPAAPSYVIAEAYAQVFGPTWRLFFASMAAYLLAQTIDVQVFHWIKQKTGEKQLWLRNNISTMSSQLVDTFTVLVLFLYKNEAVFSGDFGDLLVLIFSVYVAKVCIAALDTPLCYLSVWWVRKFLAKDTSLA
jgi:uncharacterized integral membrane protein (TIGR00697 family)